MTWPVWVLVAVIRYDCTGVDVGLIIIASDVPVAAATVVICAGAFGNTANAEGALNIGLTGEEEATALVMAAATAGAMVDGEVAGGMTDGAGATGVNGVTGATGIVGVVGVVGAVGVVGTTGATGVVGVVGAVGAGVG